MKVPDGLYGFAAWKALSFVYSISANIIYIIFFLFFALIDFVDAVRSCRSKRWRTTWTSRARAIQSTLSLVRSIAISNKISRKNTQSAFFFQFDDYIFFVGRLFFTTTAARPDPIVIDNAHTWEFFYGCFVSKLIFFSFLAFHWLLKRMRNVTRQQYIAYIIRKWKTTPQKKNVYNLTSQK